MNSLKPEDVKEMDIYTKVVLDHQDMIAKALFRELHNAQITAVRLKEQIIKDNKDRYIDIMKKLDVIIAHQTGEEKRDV